MLSSIRGEDFDITYLNPKVSDQVSFPYNSSADLPQNRWGFLGNGFTQLEVDDGDLAYYLPQGSA